MSLIAYFNDNGEALFDFQNVQGGCSGAGNVLRWVRYSNTDWSLVYMCCKAALAIRRNRGVPKGFDRLDGNTLYNPRRGMYIHLFYKSVLQQVALTPEHLGAHGLTQAQVDGTVIYTHAIVISQSEVRPSVPPTLNTARGSGLTIKRNTRVKPQITIPNRAYCS